LAVRLPGHMNVPLTRAGVPNDPIFEFAEINSESEIAGVAPITGANDGVNPSARRDTSSPVYRTPILNADKT